MRALFRRLSGAWDVLIGRAYAAEWATMCLPAVGATTTLLDHNQHTFYDAIWDGKRWLRLDSPEGEAVVRRCSTDTGPIL